MPQGAPGPAKVARSIQLAALGGAAGLLAGAGAALYETWSHGYLGAGLPRLAFVRLVEVATIGAVAGAALLLLSGTVLALAGRSVPGWRGHPVLVATALIVLLLAAGNVAVRVLDRAAGPNVLLISIDTLRADHLGSYGYHRDTSPVLDRMAEAGVRFANCVSQAPATLPSHISMMTSLYPTVHGVVESDLRLGDGVTTLAEILRNEGYATGAFVDGGYLGKRFGFPQGFQAYRDEPDGVAAIWPRALRWMEKSRRNRFFCFLHCYDVHSPYEPPAPFDTMFLEKPYEGAFRATNENLNKYKKFYRGMTDEDLVPLTDDDVEQIVALYDGGIRYTDGQLGALFEQMDESGLLDETLIVITSDHGEAFLEHDDLLHGDLYYTVVHVPLILVPPSGAAWAAGSSGMVIESPVEVLDLPPTILDAIGVTSAVPFGGESLLPLVAGDPGPGVAFSEHRWRGRLRAITTPEYRLIRTLDDGTEKLFRTSKDPCEQRELGASEPEALLRTGRLLDEWMDMQEAILELEGGGSLEGGDLDEETVRQLKALGYIE